MLKKRLIFSLLVSDDLFMLSRNFNLQKVGDLDWIRKNYNFNLISETVDELVVLNVSRKEKNIDSFCKVVEKLSHNCFIPLSTGGGIKNIHDAHKLLNSGSDKLVLNSSFYYNQNLVNEIAYTYGNQCIICSIDYKLENGVHQVYTSNGSKKVEITLKEAVKNAYDLGAGEVYLTCINKDGTGQGIDIATIIEVSKHTKLQIIASGGIGRTSHMIEALSIDNVDSISTANLFYFMGDGLQESRVEIKNSGIQLASW